MANCNFVRAANFDNVSDIADLYTYECTGCCTTITLLHGEALPVVECQGLPDDPTAKHDWAPEDFVGYTHCR